MHRIEELKEKLLDELADYSGHEKYSEDDAENIKNLSGAIDHICSILMEYESENGYSERGGNYGGMSYARDGRGGSRGGNRGGSSNARGRTRARRDSMGRYSRDGGYSYADSMESMVDKLRDMIAEPEYEPVRRDIERLIQKMEQM